jgi:hypothetical protein
LHKKASENSLDYECRKIESEQDEEEFNHIYVSEFKRTRQFDQIFGAIFREGSIFFAFSIVLFTIAYLNISNSSEGRRGFVTILNQFRSTKVWQT